MSVLPQDPHRLRLSLPSDGVASWADLHEYVSTVIAQNTTVTERTNEFRLARGLLVSITHRLGIEPAGLDDCTCAEPSTSGDVADHELKCPHAGGRLS